MKTKISLALTLIVLAVVSTSCFGPPYQFQGYMIEFITKEPIPYAKATCRTQSVQCNANGYFDFSQSSLITDANGVLTDITAVNYGRLSRWSIDSGPINYVPLNAPDTIYGLVELNGETDISLAIEGGDFKAVAELNESGEYTFYNVPTNQPLHIFPYKGEKRSSISKTVFKTKDGDCQYEIITNWYLKFDE